MKSSRIAGLEKVSIQRGRSGIKSHFNRDLHHVALTTYKDCAQWEKIALSMAYAVTNQEVYVDKNDRIGGRVYHLDEEPIEGIDPDLDCDTPAKSAFKEAYPEADDLRKWNLVGSTSKGHITWSFQKLLTLGTSGLMSECKQRLQHAKDEEAEQFYKGVIIMLDALQAFNDKHIKAYEEIGCLELAERMRKVPRYPAETFREAVQSFFMQHIVVMKENPHGGNGPGRLDYYLWPYLERDLKAGRCTMEEAREIIDELFLRIDERLHDLDGWVEAIVVGGSYPNCCSAVNPLTYLMVESVMELDITHPSVYIRLPEEAPEELIDLCARYMMSGRNRAQILSDPAIIRALVKNGVDYRDAVEYACGGCMEIGIQGMNSDFLYCGWQNTAKMLELMITGGICLRTGEKIPGFQAEKGLSHYTDFESFYQDFINEAGRLTHIYLRKSDIASEYAQKARPAYLLSSMLDNCMERGRNMHAGGVKYHDYGGTHLALPDTIDGLFAIKQAVFEQKICTAEELVTAMKADYTGYEQLQKKLQDLPKYGMDNDEVDTFAARVVDDFADMYLEYRTRWGGKGKPVILTFVYSPEAAAQLGATADGRTSNKSGVAHGLTPQSMSMTEGITAAINSCGKLSFEKIYGGASTMWDMDSAWVNEELLAALIKTFVEKGGQIFQGNTTSLEELYAAQKNPEENRHIIVRVGGYSARFVTLSAALQDEIIGRMRHRG